MRKMNFRITPVGIVVIGILLAAVLVVRFGSRSTEAPAFVVALLVLFAVLGGYGARGRQKSLQEREEEFGARPHVDDDRADPQLEARDWQKERERYGR